MALCPDGKHYQKMTEPLNTKAERKECLLHGKLKIFALFWVFLLFDFYNAIYHLKNLLEVRWGTTLTNLYPSHHHFEEKLLPFELCHFRNSWPGVSFLYQSRCANHPVCSLAQPPDLLSWRWGGHSFVI